MIALMPSHPPIPAAARLEEIGRNTNTPEVERGGVEELLARAASLVAAAARNGCEVESWEDLFYQGMAKCTGCGQMFTPRRLRAHGATCDTIYEAGIGGSEEGS